MAAERVEVQHQAEEAPHIVLDSRPERSVLGKAAIGAFQRLPIVPSAEEHIRSALKRANRVTGNKAIKNRAQHARNLSARKLDAFTKELASPLSRVVKQFPACRQIHPFERALLDLTLGVDSYERRLIKLDTLRKSCLEVGKSCAGQAAKAGSMKDAFAVLDEGFASLESVFRKNAASLDAVKDVARMLRKLPAVDTAVPTVALVGAPNVGKSSLVQVLSTGLPEVCNYPFTTRTVKMGHFFVDGVPHQVTDTPGLLNRREEDRNVMERLTMACLEHLPTAVLFVIDLTGECGTSLRNQLLIHRSLRARFPLKPWVDVFSKADLLGETFADAESRPVLTAAQVAELVADESAVITASDFLTVLPSAVRISSVAETGIDELKQTVLDMLAATTMA